MTVNMPLPEQFPQLRQLWKQAFGDSDAFLDGFFATGFGENRCRCVTWNDRAVAALYWFDCFWAGKKLAYIYAVATDEDFRGKGFCGNLMADTHGYLEKAGYFGTVLVPGDRGLFDMYEKMGYWGFSPKQDREVTAGQDPIPVRSLTAAQYAEKRNMGLPQGGVTHSQEAFAYLSTFTGFFEGEDCLFCGNGGDVFQFQEFLGSEEKLPGILKGLQVSAGKVSCPGPGRDSAMFFPLTESGEMPAYFGLPMN